MKSWPHSSFFHTRSDIIQHGLVRHTTICCNFHTKSGTIHKMSYSTKPCCAQMPNLVWKNLYSPAWYSSITVNCRKCWLVHAVFELQTYQTCQLSSGNFVMKKKLQTVCLNNLTPVATKINLSWQCNSEILWQQCTAVTERPTSVSDSDIVLTRESTAMSN